LTTLQALELSNGPGLAERLDRGARRMIEAERDGDALVDRVYRRALSRPATPAERGTARRLLGEPPTAEGLADLLWAVLMLPEFQRVR
jgi:hypothetical protein